MDNIIVIGVFVLIGVVLFFNVIKIIVNIFSTSKPIETSNPLRDEMRGEINDKVRPHLHSLEAMHQKSDDSEKKFGTFVFGLFKDKFSDYVEKDEKLLESEICKCCSEYEGADCKEEFCLDGSGVSCNK
jgi:hypothetical protein